jgi:hypothetical protein
MGMRKSNPPYITSSENGKRNMSISVKPFFMNPIYISAAPGINEHINVKNLFFFFCFIVYLL